MLDSRDYLCWLGLGLFPVLPLACGGVFVDAHHLARRRVPEHLGGRLRRGARPGAAIPLVPDEIADDREHDDDHRDDELSRHDELRSMIAAVPYATTSVMVWPSSDESKRIIT